jgi:hypothetical protein
MANKALPKNSYIQVLNLFYICDKELSVALNKIEKYPQIVCDKERKPFPFLWYVWGTENKGLNVYKPRLYNVTAENIFKLIMGRLLQSPLH